MKTKEILRNDTCDDFVKGKKQEIECIMHCYVYYHERSNQDQYWEEYSEKMV